MDVPANQTLVVVVEETNLAQTAGSTYTVQVSGLVGDGVGPGPCGGGGELTLEAKVKSSHDKSTVSLRWSPADGGKIKVFRDGVSIGNTPDDGKTKDKLGKKTGTFTYQVCEPDTGDCSNEVEVTVP